MLINKAVINDDKKENFEKFIKDKHLKSKSQSSIQVFNEKEESEKLDTLKQSKASFVKDSSIESLNSY